MLVYRKRNTINLRLKLVYISVRDVKVGKNKIRMYDISQNLIYMAVFRTL